MRLATGKCETGDEKSVEKIVYGIVLQIITSLLTKLHHTILLPISTPKIMKRNKYDRIIDKYYRVDNGATANLH